VMHSVHTIIRWSPLSEDFTLRPSIHTHTRWPTIGTVVVCVNILYGVTRNIRPLGVWMFTSMPMYISVVKSHLITYPVPKNINSLWNLGIMFWVTICIQLLTGLLLAIHYTPHSTYAYESLVHVMRYIHSGNAIRYMHSYGGSVVFLLSYVHIGRGVWYGTDAMNTFVHGIIIFLLLMATSFLGYVLPWAQMSFWGATVITNLLEPMPYLVEWVCGDFTVSNLTLKRFFITHFIIPFIVSCVVVIHLLYLHLLSSRHPLAYSSNHKLPFSLFPLSKDMLCVFVLCLILLMLSFNGTLVLSHPFNASPVSILVTPLHIVPEWYFLPLFDMLKVIPDKLTGLVVVLCSVSVFCVLVFHHYGNEVSRLSVTGIMLSVLLLLMIGGQMSTPLYVTYGRLLVMVYWYCISWPMDFITLPIRHPVRHPTHPASLLPWKAIIIRQRHCCYYRLLLQGYPNYIPSGCWLWLLVLL